MRTITPVARTQVPQAAAWSTTSRPGRARRPWLLPLMAAGALLAGGWSGVSVCRGQQGQMGQGMYPGQPTYPGQPMYPGPGPMWQAGPGGMQVAAAPQAGLACTSCGSAGCDGASCGQPPREAFAPPVQIGGSFREGSLSTGLVGGRIVRPCPCGGAGCDLCRGTGPLRPGYLRAAAFGWMSPNGCVGCRPDGYPAGASPYPYPWDQQAHQPAAPGTYENFGNTCCGPYWYDFLVEGVILSRGGSGQVGLVSDGIRGFGPPNLVLASDSADFDFEPGFRITGRFQLNAVYNLEATYLGGLTWQDQAVATSETNSLFSVFSDFGNQPLGGFQETDQASRATADTFSELDSVEINYRRSWVSPDYRVNGSWFIGARYIRLEDLLALSILVREHANPFPPPPQRPDAFTDYRIAVKNDLVGPQLGTSLVTCVIPGFSIGGEAKAGLFGNAVRQNSSLVTSSTPVLFNESFDDTELGFASEGSAYFIWQFHPLAKLRAGYEVLFLSGIATGASNFNPVLPFDQTRERVGGVDHDDQTVFHGARFGFELGW